MASAMLFLDLPDEMLGETSKYLEGVDLLNLCHTSSRCQKVLSENAYWERVCVEECGVAAPRPVAADSRLESVISEASTTFTGLARTFSKKKEQSATTYETAKKQGFKQYWIKKKLEPLMMKKYHEQLITKLERRYRCQYICCGSFWVFGWIPVFLLLSLVATPILIPFATAGLLTYAHAFIPLYVFFGALFLFTFINLLNLRYRTSPMEMLLAPAKTNMSIFSSIALIGILVLVFPGVMTVSLKVSNVSSINFQEAFIPFNVSCCLLLAVLYFAFICGPKGVKLVVLVLLTIALPMTIYSFLLPQRLDNYISTPYVTLYVTMLVPFGLHCIFAIVSTLVLVCDTTAYKQQVLYFVLAYWGIYAPLVIGSLVMSINADSGFWMNPFAAYSPFFLATLAVVVSATLILVLVNRHSMKEVDFFISGEVNLAVRAAKIASKV